MKKQIKKKERNDPYYQKGVIAMERILDIPRQEKGASLTTELMSIVEQNVMNSVEPMIEIRKIKESLPDLSEEEVAARAVKKGLTPLKNLNGNPFGSQWNQLMAEEAGRRLGLSSQDLHKIIAQEGPTGLKLREKQKEVAKETEALLRKTVLTRASTVEGIKLEALRDKLVEETRRDLLELSPDLPKQAKEDAIEDVVGMIIRVMEFSEGQRIDFGRMREILLRARLGEELRLIDLHCLAFVNDPIKGISVSSTAEDFETIDANGSRLKISQRTSFNGIKKMAQILSDGEIQPVIEVMVVDNDKFVFPGQEENVADFIESLKRLMKNDKVLGRFRTEFVLASSVTHPEKWEMEWQSRSQRGDKLAERLVNEEFERLAQRNLPTRMKTREFARIISGRSFCVQAAIGSHLAEREMILTMQKTKAHQQATELANVGAKSFGRKSPIIMAHWTGQEIIGPMVK